MSQEALGRQIVGAGVRVGSSSSITGIGRYVDGIPAVLMLMSEDVSESILIVNDAGATGIAPLLPDARAVICTSGGPTSHLALVAKEYDVGCVMSARLERAPASLNGLRLTIEANGCIVLESL